MADKQIAEIFSFDGVLSGSELIHFVRDGNSRSVSVYEISGLGAFGAVGDGSTNDRAALLSASDAAKEMILPSGVYAIASDLTIDTKVEFRQGAKLLPASGVTVTLAGGYYADEEQHVFDISLLGRCFATKASPSTQYHWGAISDASYTYGTGALTGTDNRAAIQACIDNAMYWNGASVAYLAPGSHKVVGTLHLGYGDTFRRVALAGPNGGGSPSMGSTFRTLDLYFTTWENAIEIQGARHTVVKNINLQGPWFHHIEAANNLASFAASETIDGLVAANWVPSGAPGDCQHRYKYSSGIHIDPRSGTQPATYYSNVNYPTGYPGVNYGTGAGLGAQYGKNYSSQVTIEDCCITGFGCGVAIQGCDADGNSDYTKLVGGTIQSCFICLAWGNTQSRLINIEATNFVRYYYGYDTKTIGRQNGKPQVFARSQELGLGIYLGNVENMSYSAGFLFSHCYGEICYSLGTFSTSSTGGGTVTFQSCEFDFSHTGRQIPRQMLKLLYTFAIFSGTTIGGDMACPFIIDGSPAAVRFTGLINDSFTSTNWTGGTTATSLAHAIAHDSTMGLMFISQTGDQGPWTGGGNGPNYNLTSLGSLGVSQYGSYGQFARSDVSRIIPFCAVKATSTIQPNAKATDCYLGTSITSIYTGALSALTHTNRDLSMTLASSTPFGYRQQIGLVAGGILLHQNTGMLFLVTSGTNTQIYCEQLNDYNQTTNAHVTTITSGSHGNFFGTATGHYVPSYDCNMSFTNGSATVTFARPDGYDGFHAQFPSGCAKVGTVFNTGLIETHESYSDVIVSAAGNLTMSGNAILTTTVRPGLWFVPR